MRDPAIEMLRGPRGRRLCLEYVCRVDEQVAFAVFRLSSDLDPSSGSVIRFGPVGHAVDDPRFAAGDVAALIREAALGSTSVDRVREAMVATMGAARYWQAPEGADVVATIPEVRDCLLRVAREIAASLPASTAPAADAQWTVDWRLLSESGPLPADPSRALAEWSADARDDEERSARERPADPDANWSGAWWSVPRGCSRAEGRNWTRSSSWRTNSAGTPRPSSRCAATEGSSRSPSPTTGRCSAASIRWR